MRGLAGGHRCRQPTRKRAGFALGGCWWRPVGCRGAAAISAHTRFAAPRRRGGGASPLADQAAQHAPALCRRGGSRRGPPRRLVAPGRACPRRGGAGPRGAGEAVSQRRAEAVSQRRARQSASRGRGAGGQSASGGRQSRSRLPGRWKSSGLAPGAGAGLQQQAQEVRWRLSEQEADMVNLELYQRELAGRVPAPTEYVPTVTPAAPAITSLMIKNIPMVVTQGDLLDLVDQTGFANVYDYVYQPTDFDSRTTQGHAFVNFVTPRDAREFFIRWNGSRLTGVAGAGTIATAVLEVKASALQGYEENVRRWTASRMRRISNSELHPFIARRLAAQ
ncbi:unnamed protein product [Prorocentrum cordatum]|uniref:RRM domain-containing protein n=1 Tax=Prorocentrum cordatum TaxID=2364126 RepID=A0ABN9Q4N4_9DINO|nr:unnamed protein product [Polarella glacialis]